MIETKRLILRAWQKEDLEPFAKLNSDPRVMEFFPKLLNQEESNQLAHLLGKHIEEKGWGFWAVSIKNGEPFIGFIGLLFLDKVHFSPAVEVGWRLAFDFWGKGYATEGALACLDFGFKNLQLEEIVSFTAYQNLRSRAVMERIRMHTKAADDFDHPKLEAGHPLRRHVLYRIKKEEFV